ncbi:GDSL-type esterase/lipase family protein [Candidatus Gracilibacteria bacterium]|nr:GDSL-type esterase/lipase family protein [Candidatus Gracilibacteria bacterium]
MTFEKSKNANNYQEKILSTSARRDSITEKLTKELISVPVRDFIAEACKLFEIDVPDKDSSLSSSILKLQEKLEFPKIDKKNGQDGILGAITFNALVNRFPQELNQYRLTVKQRNSLGSVVSESAVEKREVAIPPSSVEVATPAVENEKPTSADQVILIGDSLTCGYRGKVSIAGKKIPTSYNGKYVKGGKSITNMSRDLQEQYKSGKLDRITSAVILGGANNVAVNSAQKIIDALKNMVEILTSKKPPAHVVLVTLPPMLGYKGFVHKEKIMQKTTEINNWIRAQAQANPQKISCVDLYNMINDPENAGFTKQGFTSDGLHLSGKGYGLLASEVKKIIA